MSRTSSVPEEPSRNVGEWHSKRDRYDGSRSRLHMPRVPRNRAAKERPKLVRSDQPRWRNMSGCTGRSWLVELCLRNPAWPLVSARELICASAGGRGARACAVVPGSQAAYAGEGREVAPPRSERACSDPRRRRIAPCTMMSAGLLPRVRGAALGRGRPRAMAVAPGPCPALGMRPGGQCGCVPIYRAAQRIVAKCSDTYSQPVAEEWCDGAQARGPRYTK